MEGVQTHMCFNPLRENALMPAIMANAVRQITEHAINAGPRKGERQAVRCDCVERADWMLWVGKLDVDDWQRGLNSPSNTECLSL